MNELKPCPFCGAGVSEVRPNGRVWTGQRWGEPSSFSVRHWCSETPGQPQRMLERVGRDEASAKAAWNLRWLPVFDADRVAAEVDSKTPRAALNPSPLMRRCGLHDDSAALAAAVRHEPHNGAGNRIDPARQLNKTSRPCAGAIPVDRLS